MKKDTGKHITIGLLLGLLVATAPNWLSAKGQEMKSTYDAPWVHPSKVSHVAP